MDFEEKCNEIEEDINTIEFAISEINDEYCKNCLVSLKEEKICELEGLQIALKKEREKEQKALELEYRKSVI